MAQAGGFFELCARFYQWFWRSPGVRWTMIFLCALIGVVMSAPLWGWLAGGAPRPDILNPDAFRDAHGQPASMTLLSTMTGVLVAIPLLLASVRVSEDIDIKNGVAWPVHGKAWWMAAGRYLRRAILLLPIALLGALVAFEALKWGAHALANLAPPSRALLDKLFTSQLAIVLIPGFVALGIVGAWRLSVLSMTRKAGVGGPRRGGLKIAIPIARGVFFLALAGGAVAYNFYFYRGEPVTAGGLLGPTFDNDLWWLGTALHWLFWLMVAILLGLALRELARAFAANASLGTPEVHGRADLASLEKASEAARGHRAPDRDEGLNLNY